MWDIKYRPVRFTDVLGQEGTVEVLKARLLKKTAFDTSYIFSGGHGQGKTTLARILGRAMLCQNLTAEAEPCNQCESCKDALNETAAALSEMDAASRGTVEYAREIVNTIPFVVEGAPKRIYIFDEVHRMSAGAQDVLLKPIEDKRLVGIFCTTEPEKIRGPIRSRCEVYQIRRVTREDILKRMKLVLTSEQVEHEDDAVLTVIDYSGGHVRDILNRLEMVAQLGPVSLQAVRDHLNLSAVSTYYKVLLSLGDPATAVRLAEDACELVSPEEVSEGIAEAAMNSYRLAHNMHTEFTKMDKELAVDVHKLYGDTVLKFSEYFLRSYKVTRMSLLSDILMCHGGLPSAAPAIGAPVVVQLAPAAPAPVVAQVPVVKAPELAPPPPASTAPAAVREVAPAPVEPTRPANSVGNRGSWDPEALTSLDDKGVPLAFPRGKDVPKVSVPHGPKDEFLTPDEFRRKFYVRCAAFSFKTET